mmetsp:Transcript_41924/g.50803  ORF Transcript_41924/g.50803 Transcript_41924/m.50803 type:complete len:139 (-) Transcript_41924:792-1208(-)
MGTAPTARNKGTKTKKGFKQHKRAVFLERHIDQVWEDVRKDTPVHTSTAGPSGTTDVQEHDEDRPAGGAHYCIPCSKYFQSAGALVSHQKTKAHKKRVKVLKGDRPHNAEDAEAAAGRGKPDNGETGDDSGTMTMAMC